ncbi:hypothetical protein CPB83DRAFT_896305 [Crepidotus variabilis]|uniref:Uncharacterized protein n=1 Tax=Crepidotus variabilis TaxID=179855 RepID=A0A9P6JMN6_9AGAR|nr:hypothetical protein CPB83DRAFT_896305 [Crepidotus variabilis]
MVQIGTPKWIPRREGNPLPSAKGRFNIEIVSVYYFGDRDSLCAAVIIRTSFELPEKRLKYAKCPLTIHHVAEDVDKQPLAISHYYPEQHEFVQVNFHTGQREWYFDPTIEALEVKAHIGGIKKARSDDKPSVISLQAKNDQDATPRISWHYEDRDKSRYPGVVDVLLVVENPSAGNSAFFEFKLQLTKDLKVDVHGPKWERFTDPMNRWVGLPDAGTDGWNFKVRGAYKPELAKQALSNMTNEAPPAIGLKAAAKSMLAAMAHPAMSSSSFSSSHSVASTSEGVKSPIGS